MRLYDLDLLTYCRDPKCRRKDAHPVHDDRTRVVIHAGVVDEDDDVFEADDAIESDAIDIGPVYVVCDDCGLMRSGAAERCGYCRSPRTIAKVDRPVGNHGVCDAIIDLTYAAVGTYVPTAFGDIHRNVVDIYGSITERSVQRAMRVLIDDRRVASLSSAATSLATRRNPKVNPPGWYVRYDSPKLWSRVGLRDLMSVVAEHQTDMETGRNLRYEVCRG